MPAEVQDTEYTGHGRKYGSDKVVNLRTLTMKCQ